MKRILFLIIAFLILIKVGYSATVIWIPTACSSVDGYCNVARVSGSDSIYDSTILLYPFAWTNFTSWSSQLASQDIIQNISIHIKYWDMPKNTGAGNHTLRYWNTTHWINCYTNQSEQINLVDVWCINQQGNFSTVDSLNQIKVSMTGNDSNYAIPAIMKVDYVEVIIEYIPSGYPIISFQSPTNTTYNDVTTIWVNITTDSDVVWCGRSLDGTANVTMTNSSGNWNNLMTVSLGGHNIKVSCNDTANNMTISSPVYFTIADTQNPTYSSQSANETKAGYPVRFRILYDDNIALQSSGQYTFSTNNTGTWVNDSTRNFTATPEWINNDTILNSIIGMVVGYRWYATDNGGNQGDTPIYTLTTTCTYLSPSLFAQYIWSYPFRTIDGMETSQGVECPSDYTDYCQFIWNYSSRYITGEYPTNTTLDPDTNVYCGNINSTLLAQYAWGYINRDIHGLITSNNWSECPGNYRNFCRSFWSYDNKYITGEIT